MKAFHRLHTLRMENDAAGMAFDEMRPRFDRLANRVENGTAPRAVSAFNLFQTPAPIAAQLVALLGLQRYERVLEPSAGLGRILDALEQQNEPLRTTAVEVAPQLCQELYRQQRGCKLIQRDFLSVEPEETGLFDAVAMNPPFHLRADIRHIRHALTFLRPGGRLAALCLNTHHRAEAFKSSASEWIELPESTFAAEDTRVPTVLCLLTN